MMESRGGGPSPSGSAPRFTPTPEAVEAVAKALLMHGRREWEGAPFPEEHLSYGMEARAAIAAFVEAEGLEVEISQIGTTTDGAMVEEIRLVGPWRKRHASPDATQ